MSRFVNQSRISSSMQGNFGSENLAPFFNINVLARVNEAAVKVCNCHELKL